MHAFADFFFLEYTRGSHEANCKGDERPERDNHKEILGSVGLCLHKLRLTSAFVEDTAHNNHSYTKSDLSYESDICAINCDCLTCCR